MRTFPHKKLAMKNGFVHSLLLAAVLLLPGAIFAQPAGNAVSLGDNHPALRDAVILIIRHAEKPDAGPELSAAGQNFPFDFPPRR